MKKLVLPGDFLATEEEYEAGANTFVDEQGRILADSVGTMEVDPESHEMRVKKTTRAITPIDTGSMVMGKVVAVKSNMAVIEFAEAMHNGQRRDVLAPAAGTVMVARISREYVKDPSEAFRVGDLVRARVSDVNDYGIELSTVDAELGVIKAFCCECRTPLHQFGAELKCPACARTEKRKVSSEYYSK